MTKQVGTQIIIQARMGSTRLPGKILMPFTGGYAFLGWLIERAKLSKQAERVVVATTDTPKDDPTEALSRKAGVECFRGSETDVLGRFWGAAQTFPSDVIAQVNGDEPLADIGELDRMIEILREEGLDYANNHPAGLPLGTGAEAYTSAAFARVVEDSKTSYEREHVTPHFYQHPDDYKQREVTPVSIHPFAPKVRLTLDTEEDMGFLKALAHEMNFSAPAEQPATNEILSFLEGRPGLVSINEKIVQKTFPKRN